jgi:hypothetical protein
LDAKCSKLTNLLKNKTNEAKKANDKVKKVTTANKELREKLKAANNTKAALESKTKPEKQVEDLLETCGHSPAKKVSFERTIATATSETKCIFNDKVRCNKGQFSKTGFCANFDQCVCRSLPTLIEG